MWTVRSKEMLDWADERLFSWNLMLYYFEQQELILNK